MRLTASGTPRGLSTSRIARVTRKLRAPVERAEYFLVIDGKVPLPSREQMAGYAGLLMEGQRPALQSDIPIVYGFPDLSFLAEDYIVKIGARNGHLRVVYRPESKDNALYVTSQCNSRCAMCSQPPSREPDDDVEAHLRVIDLIPGQPELIGITGGEPTLLKDQLYRIISRLRDRLPRTPVYLLTNGRMYSYEDYVRELKEICHPSLLSAIPLYSDVAQIHDEIVGVRGAFDQTVHGIYNAARYSLPVEIRVVLHRPTVTRLPRLAEFIYRNFPFVRHVAFMGLENMGYAVKNWDLLWVDPADYAPVLESCVRSLFLKRINLSLYNHQLCTLPRSLWWFARKSISDYKTVYLDQCQFCEAKTFCGGLFASTKRRHSLSLHPIRHNPPLDHTSF